MSRPAPRRHQPEVHRTERTGWLRAGVLGANDGILSTGALLLGVVSAGGDRTAVLIAGVSGLVAGAGSMAIGEYVSVSSQRDTEDADRATEAHELAVDPAGEQLELQGIYESRGLSEDLAADVAEQLMRKDPLEAHLRDELGLTDDKRARPLEAAVWSFASFCVGALIPLLTAAVAGSSIRGTLVSVLTLVGLVGLGALAARLGGASMTRGAVRVGIGGSLALALTYSVGALLDTAVF